jgi:hypothetical protein
MAKKPVNRSELRTAKRTSKKIARAPGAKKKNGGRPAQVNVAATSNVGGIIPPELHVTPNAKKAKGLPQEIRRCYDSIVKIHRAAQSLARDARAAVLKKCFELGQEVRKLLKVASESGEEVGNIDLLAGALGTGTRQLRDAANVAAAISSKEFESLCSHAAISWSHVVQLAKVKDKQKRSTLAAQADEKCWSVRDMVEAIKDKSPTAKKRGPGKSRGLPRSPQSALRRMQKEFEKLDKSFGDIYFGKRFNVATEVGKLKSEEISDGLREEANAALKGAKSLQQKLPKIVKQLGELTSLINALASGAQDAAKPRGGKGASQRRSAKGRR